MKLLLPLAVVTDSLTDWAGTEPIHVPKYAKATPAHISLLTSFFKTRFTFNLNCYVVFIHCKKKFFLVLVPKDPKVMLNLEVLSISSSSDRRTKQIISTLMTEEPQVLQRGISGSFCFHHRGDMQKTETIRKTFKHVQIHLWQNSITHWVFLVCVLPVCVTLYNSDVHAKFYSPSPSICLRSYFPIQSFWTTCCVESSRGLMSFKL